MPAVDWDHNAYYHRLLLRKLPDRLGRVLDVGCGAGVFAAQVASRAEHVDALDRSPEMIEAAAAIAPPNVTCVLADLDDFPLEANSYDAVVLIAVLHHLPLERTVAGLSAALCPGGTLVILGVPRRDFPRELPTELVAAVGHRLLGAAFALLRRFTGGGWYRHHTSHAAMPVQLNPAHRTRDVRRAASAMLPGCTVRRLLFWRYLLVWDKAAESTR